MTEKQYNIKEKDIISKINIKELGVRDEIIIDLDCLQNKVLVWKEEDESGQHFLIYE